MFKNISVVFLPASFPPSRSLRFGLRRTAESPARRKPARTRPPRARLQTSEPPSSPTAKGAKIKAAADGQEELARPGRIQVPENLDPERKVRFVLRVVRCSCVKVSVCSFKLSLLAPPHLTLK